MSSPQCLAILKDLIALETVSRDSNLALIDYVEQYLQQHGIRATRIYNQDRTKANLYARIGPDVVGGVVLSGHTDVVPVDGQPWTTKPFELTQKGDKLYGRGTCDMKAFSAIALAKLPQMLAAPLKAPIDLALSYDEEIGCLGAPSLIEHIKQLPHPPQRVIVGEPTLMETVIAHKGIATIRTTVIGHEAHSSQVQRGVSAVTLAARIICFIDDLMQKNRAQSSDNSPFTPPYSTLHTGIVKGGTAVNIISRECQFGWDIRCVPGEQAEYYLEQVQRYSDELVEQYRAISPNVSITHKVVANVPAFSNPNGEAPLLADHLTGNTQHHAVPYAAEAGQFQLAGFDVVICGPGSIDQAHQPDEFIAIEQLHAGERFMDRLIQELSV